MTWGSYDWKHARRCKLTNCSRCRFAHNTYSQYQWLKPAVHAGRWLVKCRLCNVELTCKRSVFLKHSLSTTQVACTRRSIGSQQTELRTGFGQRVQRNCSRGGWGRCGRRVQKGPSYHDLPWRWREDTAAQTFVDSEVGDHHAGCSSCEIVTALQCCGQKTSGK